MSNYTPTTEEVRKHWQGYGYASESELGRIKGEDFDRWLAQVQIQAWENGFQAQEWRHNPYRKKETTD